MSLIRPHTLWQQTPIFWLILCALFAALGLIFFNGLKNMVSVWQIKEEYSHGTLLPLISAFLIWQKKNEIAQLPFTGSWWGLIIFLIGCLGYIVGDISTLYPIMQYSLIVCLVGLVLSLTGPQAFRYFAIPLLIFLSSVPLPNFIYKNLSFELQLLSSQIGVFIIRLFSIPVFLEGNVIDLGKLKLQVVEACSGLRYLFPLMTLGFIAANFFKGSLWQKVAIFVSTIPITVLMNSFRIGLIGVTVDWWGEAMATGFLHDFEGWVVFMGCTGILIAEMALMAKFMRPSRSLIDVLAIEFPVKLDTSKNAPKARPIPLTFKCVVALALLGALLSQVLPQKKPIEVERVDLQHFPLFIDGWRGNTERLEQVYIDQLQFNDYTIINYQNAGRDALSLYVAYYNTQSAGQSAHSPKSCIPAGGWAIQQTNTMTVPEVQLENGPLVVNRMLVQKGDTKLLVYYFFKQRHRVLTNEFLVKWYLLWDSVMLNRKDGALVRLSIAFEPDQTAEQLDVRAQEFFGKIYPKLVEYVPN
jgi:exosortase D (VPLPA-CTERM-specific)